MGQQLAALLLSCIETRQAEARRGRRGMTLVYQYEEHVSLLAVCSPHAHTMGTIFVFAFFVSFSFLVHRVI